MPSKEKWWAVKVACQTGLITIRLPLCLYSNNQVAIVPPDIMGELLGSSPRGRPGTDPKRAQNRKFYVEVGEGRGSDR